MVAVTVSFLVPRWGNVCALKIAYLMSAASFCRSSLDPLSIVSAVCQRQEKGAPTTSTAHFLFRYGMSGRGGFDI
jgi:hypothetical protein